MAENPARTKSAALASLAAELRVSIGKLNRRLREQAHAGDFTSAQKSVILRLERDGKATVSTLARAEGVRPQSMRTTVASLKRLGILTGKRDPDDARQTFFSLTAACRKTLTSSRAAREDWLQRALQAQLVPEERRQLAAVVGLLNRLTSFEENSRGT